MRNPEPCQNKASRCLTGCLSRDESGDYSGDQAVSDFRRIRHSAGHGLRCAPDFPAAVDSRRVVGGRRGSAVFFLCQPAGLFYDFCRKRRDGPFFFSGQSDDRRTDILPVGESLPGSFFCMAYWLSFSVFRPYCEKARKNTCKTQESQLD